MCVCFYNSSIIIITHFGNGLSSQIRVKERGGYAMPPSDFLPGPGHFEKPKLPPSRS